MLGAHELVIGEGGEVAEAGGRDAAFLAFGLPVGIYEQSIGVGVGEAGADGGEDFDGIFYQGPHPDGKALVCLPQWGQKVGFGGGEAFVLSFIVGHFDNGIGEHADLLVGDPAFKFRFSWMGGHHVVDGGAEVALVGGEAGILQVFPFAGGALGEPVDTVGVGGHCSSFG